MNVKKIICVVFSLIMACSFIVQDAFALTNQNIFQQKSTKSDEAEQLVKDIYKQAKKGEMIGCEFGLGSKESNISKKWGEPDWRSELGKSVTDLHPYLFNMGYNEQNIAFNIKNGVVKQLFKDNDQMMSELYYNRVKKILGEADLEEAHDPGIGWSRCLTYNVGDFSLQFHFQSQILKWITLFPKQKKEVSDESKELIKRIYKKAKKGKVIDCKFGVGSSELEIFQKMGKPNWRWGPGKPGTRQPQNEFSIGYNNGLSFTLTLDGVVEGVRYSGGKISKLTYSDIKEVLGRHIISIDGEFLSATFQFGKHRLNLRFKNDRCSYYGVS